MRGAKSCPACGFLLRHEDPPDASFKALRYVAVEMLPWLALAMSLAWLWAPPGAGDLSALLALAVIALWLWLRPKQRAQTEALLERRRYLCAQCGRRYRGADLRADGA